ncbi:hypothetical protein EMIHUDRAFT_214973 [Emiliania huxleyi CCMP1516]|uniref:ShKT domain-containing protein n=2 Tax=Emiliania huxleyi TaxID=2903 RepID=A0A0D3IIQ2_EMIH1|nr:hypothetical protein EMIHUDRAFT_214973 [Emiliania huxleyi CCMP1516]EOD11137.1 hypothetical protein EMIHUDRAFT_214973 [Emiliania huxleyi CCMP1516]|eukprot:XP_005763566.1 hypothetical protein EMIHUDRAFT_214973 [Emiliania huxleyi CCMP1516]
MPTPLLPTCSNNGPNSAALRNRLRLAALLTAAAMLLALCATQRSQSAEERARLDRMLRTGVLDEQAWHQHLSMTDLRPEPEGWPDINREVGVSTEELERLLGSTERDSRGGAAAYDTSQYQYQCEDEDSRCARWAMGGECDHNPRFMRQHCALACGCESP